MGDYLTRHFMEFCPTKYYLNIPGMSTVTIATLSTCLFSLLIFPRLTRL